MDYMLRVYQQIIHFIRCVNGILASYKNVQIFETSHQRT